MIDLEKKTNNESADLDDSNLDAAAEALGHLFRIAYYRE